MTANYFSQRLLLMMRSNLRRAKKITTGPAGGYNRLKFVLFIFLQLQLLQLEIRVVKILGRAAGSAAARAGTCTGARAGSASAGAGAVSAATAASGRMRGSAVSGRTARTARHGS